MTHVLTTSPPASEPPGVSPAVLRIAAVVALGALAVQLDGTMTNLAINTFLREFHQPLSTLQWIGSGYLLAMTAMIPLAGWAVERFGTRATWIFSLGLFLVGSLLSGLAWSAGSLIAFRVVQGLGGGMLLPLAQIILALAAGPQRMGRLMAVIGIPAMLGPVLGPVLGGLIVTDLDWRWIFFVNVPVCLLCGLLALRYLTDTRTPSGGRLDVPGLLLLSPAAALVVYGLAEAGRHGTFADRHALIPLLAGAAMLAGFVVHALRTRYTPLIDLRLFRWRSFAAAAAGVFLSGLALFGAIVLVPLYYQQVRGQDALHAGLLLVPQGLGMGLGLIVAGRLADRTSPRRLVLVGLALAAAGSGVFTRLDAHTGTVLISAALVVSGAGLGACMVPLMTASYRDLPRAAIPRATGAIRILQQLGGALGGTMLLVVLQRSIAGRSPWLPGTRVDPDALAASFGHAFGWVLAFTAVAAVAALLLPGRAAHAVGEPVPPGPPQVQGA